MKPEDRFRQDLKTLIMQHQQAPVFLDDETIQDILEETIEDMEAGRDIPPY